MSFPHAPAQVTALLWLAAIANAAEPFASFEQWKSAVLSGDKAALARLYSTNPLAVAQVGRNKAFSLDDEQQFWAELRSAGFSAINPKVLQISPQPGAIQLLLRVEAMKPDGSEVVASMAQLWTEQPGGWRIIATRRSEFVTSAKRRLPQPATPNTSLYPTPAEAEADLKAALATAAREHKRVLLMFGANWCYDCHVLDNTLHSPEFAPLLERNYVLVHVSIGDEGKDNRDLAARLGVGLDRGVPSLAVLDPDGTVVVAQKNGEFESTVKLGPEEIRTFLKKWKPAR